ncbi:hypothetical protein KQX54_012345 [Cotesia glomerata]|uniref:Uncharacterized protein n=1 Tax=Cotesia glomerata TaxID=32391 RepID=A0AAV7J142_COTGL|nr:hypothetical protein KQX54_012345 [Cotesia glomerata]
MDFKDSGKKMRSINYQSVSLDAFQILCYISLPFTSQKSIYIVRQDFAALKTDRPQLVLGSQSQRGALRRVVSVKKAPYTSGVRTCRESVPARGCVLARTLIRCPLQRTHLIPIQVFEHLATKFTKPTVTIHANLSPQKLKIF